jgi:hypothetical protein
LLHNGLLLIIAKYKSNVENITIILIGSGMWCSFSNILSISQDAIITNIIANNSNTGSKFSTKTSGNKIANNIIDVMILFFMVIPPNFLGHREYINSHFILYHEKNKNPALL